VRDAIPVAATSSSIACMMEGTPAITITLPIQKPGVPDTLLRMRSAPFGMRVMPPDVVLANAPASVLALQQTSNAVPIVFVAMTDPVGMGVVQTLARPGGNATDSRIFAQTETSTRWTHNTVSNPTQDWTAQRNFRQMPVRRRWRRSLVRESV